MDRKQKIIVSITGIVIVFLALLGLTYGYFLTRVSGNTNANSLVITTATLELVYRDGTENIVLTADNIVPDTVVGTKEFTVENTGNSNIEEYQVYLENVINDFVYTDDLVLTITCDYEKEDGSTGSCNEYASNYPVQNSKLISNSIESGEVHTYKLSLKYIESGSDQSIDMGKTLQGKIQIYDPKDIIAITGEVTGADSSTYVELHSVPKISQIKNGKYIFYGVKPDSDGHTIYVKKKASDGTESVISTQSVNVSKGDTASISKENSVINVVFKDDSDIATIDIGISGNSVTYTVGEILEGIQPFGSGTLAYEIINNAKNASGTRTVYGTPSTTVGEVSSESERVLATGEDNGGTSYYFRGNVEDNYVSFANKCWRIVRIESDGSTKLVLADDSAECSSNTLTKSDSAFINGLATYSSTNTAFNFENSSLKTALNNWYSSDMASYSSKLKNDTWCLGGNSLSEIRASDDSIYYNEESIPCEEGYIDNGYDSYEGYMCVQSTPFSYYYNTTLNSFKCVSDEESYDGKYGLMTAAEVIHAGAFHGNDISYTEKNTTYYLYDNAYSNYWYTLSRAYQENSNNYVFSVYDGDNSSQYGDYDSSGLTYSPLTAELKVRPAITLASDVEYKSGNGTIGNPYKIN